MNFFSIPFLVTSLLIPLGTPQTLEKCNWCKFNETYPNHYTAIQLGSNESIIIDGYLNDSAWKAIPFTSSQFVDIAQPLYSNLTNGYKIPKNHSTNVKVRWDNNYLYIGAILEEPFVYGSVKGHNKEVPYRDHDFEIFVDVRSVLFCGVPVFFLRGVPLFCELPPFFRKINKNKVGRVGIIKNSK